MPSKKKTVPEKDDLADSMKLIERKKEKNKLRFQIKIKKGKRRIREPIEVAKKDTPDDKFVKPSKPYNLADITSAHAQVLQSILNAFPWLQPPSDKEIADLSFLVKFHKEIAIWIRNNYTNPNTLKNYLNSLGVMLGNMGYIGLQKVYVFDAIEQRKKAQEKAREREEGKNLTEKETVCFQPFNNLIKRVVELEELVEKNPTNLKTHMLWFSLAMNMVQPPLRLDLTTMTIIKDLKDDNKKDNFLYIKNEKEMFYIINLDKVSSKKGSSQISLAKQAVKVVNRSLLLMPRDAVILNSLKEQASKRSYQEYLKQLFPSDSKCDFSQNNLRHAFVTHFFAVKHNPSTSAVEKLADEMRTSASQLRSTYNFVYAGQSKKEVEIDEILPKVPEKNEEIVDIPQLQVASQQAAGSFNLKEWGKKYRAENKEKLKTNARDYYQKHKEKVNRQKLVANLNRGNTSRPYPDTIKKYNLKFDAGRELWF